MARDLQIVWVDAFTTTPLAGNACAVVLDARGLDDATMQAIARETNLSETSFVFPGDGEADFVVRYWTPVGEIPLAGHPTIATTHALRETGAIPPGKNVVHLRMPAALIPVTIHDSMPVVYAMSNRRRCFSAPCRALRSPRRCTWTTTICSKARRRKR